MSKGSKPRPIAVPRDEYAGRWALAFGRGVRERCLGCGATFLYEPDPNFPPYCDPCGSRIEGEYEAAEVAG